MSADAVCDHLRICHGFGPARTKIEGIPSCSSVMMNMSVPRHPEIPLDLRIDIERESRRMAGYWHGRRIADSFLDLIQPADSQVEQNIQDYLRQQDDPRLTEIFARLQEIYLAHPKGK